MTKEQKINLIFNILFQYEKVLDKFSSISEQDYLNYLDRVYVLFLGYENEEIAANIKGLYKLGTQANHSTVKRIVFHIIRLLKEGV